VVERRGREREVEGSSLTYYAVNYGSRASRPRSPASVTEQYNFGTSVEGGDALKPGR